MKVAVLAVNQFAPEFTSPSYEFTVPETVPVGFRLGVINATDQDNDDLVYSLRGAGNGKSVCVTCVIVTILTEMLFCVVYFISSNSNNPCDTL